MMNSVEKQRRRRLDICTYCGWHMVVFEFGRRECQNPRCLPSYVYPFVQVD